MPEEPIEARMRVVEARAEVHEAICAERYKGLLLRLNIIMFGIGVILTAIAAGDPLVGLARRLLIGG